MVATGTGRSLSLGRAERGPVGRCDEGALYGRIEVMPSEINDAALEYLLARAGLSLTEEQKAELKNAHAAVAALAERVRKPRGRMAEPAHTYGYTEEDLA